MAKNNPRPKEDRGELRRAFGAALAEELGRVGMSQSELARQVGGVPSKVSDWVRGESEPESSTVFLVEKILGTAPGRLSRHLDYEPARDPDSLMDTFEAVVMNDPLIPEALRAGLLALYRAQVGADDVTRRRRPDRR